MKKFNTVLVLFLVFRIASGQTFPNIQQEIESYKNTKLLRSAQWSIYARYLESGEEIINYNSEMSLAPASNLKLLTTAAALDYLGEDFRFETKIFYEGDIDQYGTLHGNLYFVGGGDPTLGSNLVKSSIPLDSLMNFIISKIKDLNIKKITGNVYADDFMFDGQLIPDEWNWIDLGNYYAAPLSALTIHDNLYFLYFKPGNQAGDVATVLRTEPEIPNLKFINFMKTGPIGSGDNGYIYNAPWRYEAVLRGTIPMGKPEFSIKGSLPDPPLFAVRYLKRKLQENGISVTGKAAKLSAPVNYKEKKLILTLHSPPLKDIVFIINKRSNNLYTELLLKMVSYKINGTGNTLDGTKLVKDFFKRNNINTNGLLLYDGSGLSRENAITTKAMVELLALLPQKKYFDSFYNSLAIMGNPNDIGHFKNVGKGTVLENNVRIKSGVIEGVRAYSGYLKNKSGDTIVFSMIANNFNGTGGEVTSIHRKILMILANLK